MNYFILAFAVVLITLSFTIIIHPIVFKQLLKASLVKHWIWLIALIRLGFGLLFVFAAKDTTYPYLIMITGVVLILSGLSVPLVGLKKIKEFGAWWLNQHELLIRVMGFLALLLSICIAMAGMPN